MFHLFIEYILCIRSTHRHKFRAIKTVRRKIWTISQKHFRIYSYCLFIIFFDTPYECRLVGGFTAGRRRKDEARRASFTGLYEFTQPDSAARAPRSKSNVSQRTFISACSLFPHPLARDPRKKKREEKNSPAVVRLFGLCSTSLSPAREITREIVKHVL